MKQLLDVKELAKATNGRYEVIGFLGRGGFSFVYLAEDREKNERVALKLGANGGGGPFVTRFLEISEKRSPEGVSPDEALAEACFMSRTGPRLDLLNSQEIDGLIRAEEACLRRIQAPNFVRLLGSFSFRDRPVLVLEHVQGKTLREKIRAPEGIHVDWFLTIARVLERLRKTGALPYHGDLKPENIIISPNGKVMLLDPAHYDPQKGLFTTTHRYNPLLLRSHRADVMAIGIMLYEIPTGVVPFNDTPWLDAGREPVGEVDRLYFSHFLSYLPPSTLKPDFPPVLEKIIYRAIVEENYGFPELEEDLFAFT